MLLHFALVLHFGAIVITFCGDYYILQRNIWVNFFRNCGAASLELIRYFGHRQEIRVLTFRVLGLFYILLSGVFHLLSISFPLFVLLVAKVYCKLAKLVYMHTRPFIYARVIQPESTLTLLSKGALELQMETTLSERINCHISPSPSIAKLVTYLYVFCSKKEELSI